MGTVFLQYADVLGGAVGRPPLMAPAGWEWMCEERGMLSEGFHAAAARAVYDRVTARRDAATARRGGGGGAGGAGVPSTRRRASPPRRASRPGSSPSGCGSPSSLGSPSRRSREARAAGLGSGGSAVASPQRGGGDGGGIDLADFVSALAYAAFRRANPLWREASTNAHSTAASSPPMPLPDCLQLLLTETLCLTPAEVARQTSLKLTPRLAACCVELPEVTLTLSLSLTPTLTLTLNPTPTPTLTLTLTLTLTPTLTLTRTSSGSSGGSASG